MARLNIDTGTDGNPATGDTLRSAMTKINNNFIDVYGVVGDPSNGLLTNSTTNGDIKVQPNGTGIVEIDQLQITDAAITPLITNSDLTLTANGTGDIVLGAVTIADNRISANTSNDNLEIRASGTGAILLEAMTISDNKISANRSNDDLELDASGTGRVLLKAPLSLVTSSADGSSEAIDITTNVAFLDGNSNGSEKMNYTLASGTYVGQFIHLVRNSGAFASCRVTATMLGSGGGSWIFTNRSV